MRKEILIAALAAGISIMTARGDTCEFYVDANNGSDVTGDGTAGNPWETIQFAVNHAWYNDCTVHVAPGYYAEQVIIQQISNGLNLLGSGAEATTIDASGITYNGGVIKLPPGEGFVITGFTLTGGTFAGSGSWGGAIRGAPPDWPDDESTTTGTTVEYNRIIDNFSYGYDCTGGGVSLGADCVIRYNEFVQNSARYGAGAVYVGAGSVIEYNLFQDNLAREHGGGAIETADGSVLIRYNSFLDNASGTGSTGRGGAIYGSATIRNNLFVRNSCYGYNNGYGGAAYLTGGLFVNNTLHANIGDTRGHCSGVYCAGAVEVMNNIIANGTDGTGIYIEGGSSATADYNAYWANDLGPYGGPMTPGPHDVHGNPLFADEANDDYRLSAASPCIEAGDDTYVIDANETDLEGHARVLCGSADIGAYEFHIGDYDCDFDVDLDDFAGWPACVTGPAGDPYEEGCEPFDFHYDLDVDLDDFARLQQAFTAS